MLSVLIPVYNFDIRLLVSDLHKHLTEASIDFEILCFDDGSEEKFNIINQNIAIESRITFYKSPVNIGRASIRNALAKAAKYPYLLFMDCDSKVIYKNYIQNYITRLQKDTLLYGGRSYAPTPPNRPELHFHWLYGIRREQIPAQIRQQKPYHSFMTNNFLIPKIIFEKIQFDERLKQYGHEDTLFGMELKKQRIKIIHLNNPLEHIGLEDVNAFLQKTEQGIQNLAFLAKEQPQLETRLLKTYRTLEKMRLTGILYLLLEIIQPFILQQLKSRTPNLRWFDLYKLQLLIKAIRD